MFSGIPYGRYFDAGLFRVSIDNIRLKLVYKYQNYDYKKGASVLSVDHLCQLLDSNRYFMSGVDVEWSSKDVFKIGGYCRTCTIKGNDWSFAVMVGRYCFDADCRQVAPEAVVDYNPNKVPCEAISQVLYMLCPSALSCTVSRYDVAFDIPVNRRDVFLVPDKERNYKRFDCDGALTEYSGERSSHGAVKLYDKTKEAGLSGDVTRCEVTIEGKSGVPVSRVFPLLYAFADQQMEMAFMELPFPVQACLMHPDLIGVMLQSYTYKTRKKYQQEVERYSKCVLCPNDWNEIDSFIRSTLRHYTTLAYESR